MGARFEEIITVPVIVLLLFTPLLDPRASLTLAALLLVAPAVGKRARPKGDRPPQVPKNGDRA